MITATRCVGRVSLHKDLKVPGRNNGTITCHLLDMDCATFKALFGFTLRNGKCVEMKIKVEVPRAQSRS